MLACDVASIRRFAVRISFATALMGATEELSSPDDRTVRFRLKRPFPHLPEALAGPGGDVPAIMPERLAATSPFKPVAEIVGSGPYRFLPEEHINGARAAYERFPLYQPRSAGPVGFTAGPRSRISEAIKLNPSHAAAHVMLGQMCVYVGRREQAIGLAETGIRLSPTDPRLDRWLPTLAGAHYQLRHYAEAVEAGRRSWSLNRNWPHGLRYVVAGLAQLGRIKEAQAALAELKRMDANLEYSASVFRRTWPDPADVDYLLDGLRKAGFE